MNCKSRNTIMILNVLMMIKHMTKIPMYNMSKIILKIQIIRLWKEKKIDQIEKLFRETRVGFKIWVKDLKQRNMWCEIRWNSSFKHNWSIQKRNEWGTMSYDSILSKMKIMQDQTIVKVLKLWNQSPWVGYYIPRSKNQWKKNAEHRNRCHYSC